MEDIKDFELNKPELSNITKKLESVTCAVCKKQFKPKLLTHKYCSKRCINKNYWNKILNNRTDVICLICGKSFKQKNKKYCSLKCKRKDYNLRPYLEKNCLVCGRVFFTKDKFKKTCNKSCFKTWKDIPKTGSN